MPEAITWVVAIPEFAVSDPPDVTVPVVVIFEVEMPPLAVKSPPSASVVATVKALHDRALATVREPSTDVCRMAPVLTVSPEVYTVPAKAYHSLIEMRMDCDAFVGAVNANAWAIQLVVVRTAAVAEIDPNTADVLLLYAANENPPAVPFFTKI